MRIRIIESEYMGLDEIIGQEFQIGSLSKGNTIVDGYVVASNGILHGFVEDITEYRTEIDEDGNKIQVEVIPEVDIG
jgi:hypothetical protein